VLLSQELELPPDRDVIALADRIRAAEATGTDLSPAVPAPVITPVATPAVQAPVVMAAVTTPVATPAVAAPDPAAAYAVPVAEPVVATIPLPNEPVRPTSVALPIAAPTPRSWYHWLLPTAVGAAGVVAIMALGGDPMVSVPTLGTTRRVTLDAGLEVDPALAPDGRTLAYAEGPEGSMRIFVRRLDGGRAVSVSNGIVGDHRRPRWSPDGSRLLFQAGGAIWMVPALGGVPRAVVTALPSPTARALYPEWSPDGKALAWVRRDTVMVRALNGGPTRTLGTMLEAHSLSLSPDGRWIAAVSGNEGFIYGAAASTMDVGFISIGNLAPSSIWMFPAAGGAPVKLVSDNHLNTSPEWLGPSRVVFVSDRDGSRDLFIVAVGQTGAAMGEPRRLTTGLNAHTVSAQRSGGAIAYSVFNQSSNVWSLPIPAGSAVGTSTAKSITSGSQIVEAMEVSPDGRWLAFDADGSGSQDIYRMPLGGGDVERVVESPTDDHRPTWSADGQSLIYYSFVDGVRRAFVVSAQGGEPRMLQPGGRDEQHTPVWSPDMRHVLFHRPEKGVDQVFELTRTGDSTWSPAKALTRRGGFGARWSPDGLYLAYVAPPNQVRLMGDGPDAEAASKLLYDAGTATKARPVAIRWAPDGRAVYMKTFDADGEAAIWALGVDGGKPRQLVRFDEPLRPTRRPEFAVDANRLYFTLAQSESDVWVMGLR
jgi:Tol biopolymer transport system component